MAGRNQRNVYLFISDSNKMYYSASRSVDGSWIVTGNARPNPLQFNPANLKNSSIEFGTNEKYFSLIRTISYPLDFVEDGAAILNYLYLNGKGFEQLAYLTVIEWQSTTGVYELSYTGKFDFSQKKYSPKSNTFSIPTVDDGPWGVLSKYDNVELSIDCSPTNPKAIPVLFDGVTLINKYTFAPVVEVLNYPVLPFFVFPISLVNQDGDSSGLSVQSQSFNEIGNSLASLNDFLHNNPAYLAYSYYGATPVFSGNFSLKFQINTSFTGAFSIFWMKNTDNALIGIPPDHYIFGHNTGHLQTGVTYNVPFNLSEPLAAGESITIFGYYIPVAGSGDNMQTFIQSSLFSMVVKTKAQPSIAYALRPLDLLQEIVNKATLGRYSINSNYFSTNNNIVALPGSSIRNQPNAYIATTFNDFFKSYDASLFLALRVINGELWIEPAKDIYTQQTVLFYLGEVSDLELENATEFEYNSIDIGSPNQDYRHPSGILEVNSTNKFSLPVISVDKKMSVVPKYRQGCYDIEFLRIDYQGQSTQDNSGDTSVYMVDISDETEMAQTEIENFVDVTINSEPLEPLIRYPSNNAIINYNKPRLEGVCIPGNTVNVYYDSVLDGSTTAGSDGSWSYDFSTALSSYDPGIATGIHIIDVTYGTEADPKSTITVTIDTTQTCPIIVTYPSNNQSLYDNEPLIRGIAQQGTSLVIKIDGVTIETRFADGSCLWKTQAPVLINGNHTIDVNGVVSTFNVQAYTEYPLITSFSQGFQEVNNLPLIKGVGVPGTLVNVWLDYITYKSLGDCYVDANGDWSLQVVPTTYIDPISLATVVMAPISDGLHILSTSLQVENVSINIVGYKLNRPEYSSITGVTDNTVFNTTLSPKRALMARYPFLSSIMQQQKNGVIQFQTASKNPNQVTTLNGVTISERASINQSELGDPLFMLEYATFKTRVPLNFNQILYNFSKGGLVVFDFRGTTFYCLPIGSMSMANITDDVQNWKLLLSPKTSYNSLLNAYKNGININLMKNSFYHSDYNSLHFVDYDFTQDEKYNNKELYEDWFNNRNEPWVVNPMYIQKFQRTDPIVDQIIANGVNDLTLCLYKCLDGSLVDTFNYLPVTPAPIPIPDIVFEVSVDLSIYPEDQYFFVVKSAGNPVAISERIETRDKWPKTILVEAFNSINKTGFFFSTGIKSIFRTEGLVAKLQPNPTFITYVDELGNSQLLYSVAARKRDIYFGDAAGMPDYLYLKITEALQLDNLFVEGQQYVMSQDDKLSSSDDVSGFPMYYFKVAMLLSINNQGNVFAAAPGAITGGITIVADAVAFGGKPGSLINITLE